MRRRDNGSLVTLLLLALFIAGAIFIYNSVMFEREAPKALLKGNGFWNLRSPLELEIKDQSGIKEYSVVIESSIGKKELSSARYATPKEQLRLKIKPPRSAYALKDKLIKIHLYARDASRWNFLQGNVLQKEFVLQIDRDRPQVSVIANSYKIARGGSALVIFRAVDANLDKLYIKTNFGKIFYATPFYKEGYYIALLAWPIRQKRFRADIIVTDLAGNRVKSHIPLFIKNLRYRVSRLNIKDRFLKGKISDLATMFDQTQGVEEPLEQFKIINETVRAQNESLIHDITSKVPKTRVDSFSIKRMHPLKNAKKVADFGDHRLYYYKGKKVSESYHLGLDLASKSHAPIRPQNSGDVVFADFNGLYGNMPIIHHGLGLYTLYGHCSSIEVQEGDRVGAKETIAYTGKSGYAMGDHLHFGVLVQGVEVRPKEWMDGNWIKLNILDVIKTAKQIIDKG